MNASQCFYDFETLSNAKFKTDDNSVSSACLKRLQPFHQFELQRSRVLGNFHQNYEKKFTELFYLNNSPKDLMNFFLHEQLSNHSRSYTHQQQDFIYDQLLPKPENILQVKTHVNRIKNFYVLCRNPLTITKEMSVKKFLEKIQPFLKVAVHYDENTKLNSLLRQFKRKLDNENYHIDRTTVDEFDAIFLKFATYYEPHIERKVAEFADFLNQHIREVSMKLAEISRKVSLENEHFDESIFMKQNRINFRDDSRTVKLEYENQSYRISNIYLDKLKALYMKHNKVDSLVDLESKEGQVFLSRVFSLISRYESYFKNSIELNEGYGFQAAIPEHVFREMKRLFDVTEEMFASPFNCFFANYCSAFGDTDVFFGSRGSFFDYNPIEGSFECNPPFSTDIYERMLSHIENLLSNSSNPLSFIIFIPERINGEDLNVDRIRKSKFLRETFIVLYNQHRYVSGAQHLQEKPRHMKFYDPCHNTQVFILQNKAGFEKWKPTQEKIDAIQKCMARCGLDAKFEQNQDHYNYNRNRNNYKFGNSAHGSGFSDNKRFRSSY